MKCLRIAVLALVSLAVIAGPPIWAQEGAPLETVASTQSEEIAVIVSGADRHVFTIEVVDTPETRAAGLMFREHLAPDSGMLFDFFEERETAFWMQNTLIPLDMIFIRADGGIARVHHNAQPMDRTTIPSGEPVRFVLEIPGGRSEELGIAAGDVLEHPRVADGAALSPEDGDMDIAPDVAP